MIPGLRMLVAGAAIVLALTACAPVSERVDSALDAAIAATASAADAVGLLEDGRALPAFADTVLGDALTELDGSATDLTETGAITDGAGDRREALGAIRAAVDVVLAARDEIAAGGDLTDDRDDLEAAVDALRAAKEGPP